MRSQTILRLLGLCVLTAAAIFGFSHLSPIQAMINRAVMVPGDATSTYHDKCASCHGKDGRGKTLKGKLSHARDLTSSEWQNDVTDERIFNSISNGKGKMPSFKKKLTDAQIEELVAYVRHFKK